MNPGCESRNFIPCLILDRDEGCAIFMPLLQVDSTSHAGELSSDLCYRLNYCEHDQRCDALMLVVQKFCLM